MADSSSMTQQEVLEAFGDRLRRLRKARRLRQLDMENFGLNHKYYQRLESGQVNPTLLTMYRLALALEVSVYDLFRAEADCLAHVSPDADAGLIADDAHDLTTRVTVTFAPLPLGHRQV